MRVYQYFGRLLVPARGWKNFSYVQDTVMHLLLTCLILLSSLETETINHLPVERGRGGVGCQESWTVGMEMEGIREELNVHASSEGGWEEGNFLDFSINNDSTLLSSDL